MWYLVSPIWRVKELNEPLPGASGPVIDDNFGKMDSETAEKFSQAMAEMGPKTKTMNDSMPDKTLTFISSGSFQARAHDVKGTAALGKIGEQKILRFEDFETINGPDLHIYLASDLSDKDYVDLGAIRATKGNVNYNVDEKIDTAKYKYVLVWCEPFRVLFSYAELK